MSATMSTLSPSRQLALAFFGPALAAAAMGLELAGPTGALTRSIALPLILAGLGLVMLPALYISIAFQGVAPPAKQVLAATQEALQGTAFFLLCTAPALFFMVSTADKGWTVIALAHLVVATAVVLGLRRLYLILFEDGGTSGTFVTFLIWSVVGLAIGLRLFHMVLGIA